MSSASKVWFITGTSKGFGHIWAKAALERGDKVAATARRPDSLSDLVEDYGENVLPIELDVTDKAAVDAAVEQAHDHFGRLDVVVNNAGYGLFGTIKEVTEEQARAQIETNLFGALWVTKAALPYLREQGSGHIIQVSSIGGVNAFRPSASTTPRSGPSRGSARLSARRSAGSGSRSRSSSPPATRPTGAAPPRSRPSTCRPTKRCARNARRCGARRDEGATRRRPARRS